MVNEADVRLFADKCKAIFEQVGRDIIGQEDIVELTVIAMIAGGNVLLEGVPGIGKTRLIRSLGRVFSLPFSRIQFTPDLMPADITGTNVLEKDEKGNAVYTFRPGPIFSHIVLADEINRATPKSQSALLEAMQEHTVTVDGKDYRMEEPFFVLATQNPVDFVGTYPLPEAQMDRFFMRVSIGYPSLQDEIDILDRYCGEQKPMESVVPVCSAEDVIAMQQTVKTVYCSKEVRAYIAAICAATRNTPLLSLGASTRAAIALIHAAQANAMLCGRDYIIPEDVQHLAPSVLCHRLSLSAEARMRGYTNEQAFAEVLSAVRIPVRIK